MSTEFNGAMRLVSSALPLVPLFVSLECRAAWSGKWCLNTSSETVKQLGGPWDTEGEAVAAVLATGRYRLREGTKTPHLDPI